MNPLQQARDHWLDLQAAARKARADGDWDRVDFIGLRIDAAQEEIDAADIASPRGMVRVELMIPAGRAASLAGCNPAPQP